MTQKPISPGSSGLPSLRQRLTAALTGFWSPSRVGFGPGEPLEPQAPKEPIRREDYLTGRNFLVTPRASESHPVTYSQLRALSRSLGVLRTIIEQRKDEMKGLEWDISVRKEYEAQAETYKDDVREIRRFFEKPDRETPFDVWLGTWLEDMFVIDAPTLFKRRNRRGDLHALENVDGSTILLLVDDQGRLPAPPEFCYQQVIKGMPRTDWTKNELLYSPYNLASDGVYGFSHVEGIVLDVNTALRRATQLLYNFTAGNIPNAYGETPADWTPDQIQNHQDTWDALLSGNMLKNVGMKWVPKDSKITMTNAYQYMPEFDEWMARVCCARFGVSPAPFVRMINRATAETIEEASTDSSMVPLMQHIANIINDVIATDLRKPYLEFKFTSGQFHQELQDAEIMEKMEHSGALSINEWRKSRGLDPDPHPNADRRFIMTGSGPVFVDEMGSVMAGGPGLGNAGPSLQKMPDLISRLTSATNPDAAQDELGAWERFSTTRVREGKALRAWTPRDIPAALATDIAQKVATCKSVDDVKAVFHDARQKLTRTRTPQVRGELDALISRFDQELSAAVSASARRLKS